MAALNNFFVAVAVFASLVAAVLLTIREQSVLHVAPQQVTAEQARVSAAVSLSKAARRYLHKDVEVNQWKKVLVSEDAKTVCLEYSLNSFLSAVSTGVVILSEGHVSQIKEDWDLQCAAGMYDLTSEANQPEAIR